MIPALASSLLAAAAQYQEYGTVEFSAGPARGVAFFHVFDNEPIVEVTLHNDGAAPIWWRGPGMGCVGCHWSVTPATVEGELLFEGGGWVGCSMEDSLPTTPEQLEQWVIPPGGAAASWIAQPFAGCAGQLSVKPPLDRWAWCHAFTMPRATPPPESMDFETPGIVLAWSRATGPRAFVEKTATLHFPHFDPFDATPFFRDGPAPVRIGPLAGTAVLTEGPAPRVILRLTNPTSSVVHWDTASPGDSSSVAFLDESDTPGSGNVRVSCGGRAPSPPPPPHAPGESRLYELHPFADPTFALIPPPGRWHWEASTTLPIAGAFADAYNLRGSIHVVWDPRFGLAVGLTDAVEGFRPFGESDVDARLSGALRVGDAWFLASAMQGSPRHLEIEVIPVGRQCHWRSDHGGLADTEEFRWQDGPEFGDRKRWLAPDPQLEFRKPGDYLDWLVSSRTPGRLCANWELVTDSRAHAPRGEDEPWPAWEWRRLVMVPREAAPATSADFTYAMLSVRWDPAKGLELAASPFEAR